MPLQNNLEKQRRNEKAGSNISQNAKTAQENMELIRKHVKVEKPWQIRFKTQSQQSFHNEKQKRKKKKQENLTAKKNSSVNVNESKKKQQHGKTEEKMHSSKKQKKTPLK